MEYSYIASDTLVNAAQKLVREKKVTGTKAFLLEYIIHSIPSLFPRDEKSINDKQLQSPTLTKELAEQKRNIQTQLDANLIEGEIVLMEAVGTYHAFVPRW